MSKRCPSCGASNDSDRIFCSACGDPLDADLKLIMDLEKRQKPPAQKQSRPVGHDEEVEVPKVRKEEKKSPLPWIILGAAAIAILVWWLL